VGGDSDYDYECQQHFSQIIQKSATIRSLSWSPANLTPLFGRVDEWASGAAKGIALFLPLKRGSADLALLLVRQ